MLKDLVQAGMPVLLQDKETEILAMASRQHRGMYMPKPLDTEGLSDPSKILKHEATKLSKKAVQGILPRVYPSRRRISCTRCFPDGCGTKTSQSGNGVTQQANPSKANGLEHKICCAEVVAFEETMNCDTHRNKAVMEILPRACPPRRRISAARYFHEDCTRRIPQAQASKKAGGQDLANKANVSIRQFGSMNLQQEEAPTGLALTVHREIMVGLMASVKFPWRQGKGAQNINLTGGIEKGKIVKRAT